MTINDYLAGKYGNHAWSLTRVEALIFGVPYPLVHGWVKRHGEHVITEEQFEKLKEFLPRQLSKKKQYKKVARALEVIGSSRQLTLREAMSAVLELLERNDIEGVKALCAYHLHN